MKRNLSLPLLCAFGLATASGAAEATLVHTDTVLARGPEYASSIELSLAGPGNYRITATDLNWLNASFQALSFGVFTATARIETMVGAGTLEFFHAGQGKVFLQIYAKPAAGRSAGLIGLKVDGVAVVALPASLWLLLSALGASGLWRWASRRVATVTQGADGSAGALGGYAIAR